MKNVGTSIGTNLVTVREIIAMETGCKSSLVFVRECLHAEV